MLSLLLVLKIILLSYFLLKKRKVFHNIVFARIVRGRSFLARYCHALATLKYLLYLLSHKVLTCVCLTCYYISSALCIYITCMKITYQCLLFGVYQFFVAISDDLKITSLAVRSAVLIKSAVNCVFANNNNYIYKHFINTTRPWLAGDLFIRRLRLGHAAKYSSVRRLRKNPLHSTSNEEIKFILIFFLKGTTIVLAQQLGLYCWDSLYKCLYVYILIYMLTYNNCFQG